MKNYKKILILIILINFILMINLIINSYYVNNNLKQIYSSSVKNYNDYLMPTVIFYNDDHAEVTFENSDNISLLKKQLSPDTDDLKCLIMNSKSYKIEKDNIQKCLSIMKKDYNDPDAENTKLIENVPGYVPNFGEYTQQYEFNKIDWDKDFADKSDSYNPFHRLGYYNYHKVTEEMYDDDPSLNPDFETPHMGIINDDNYCNNHDQLMLYNNKISPDYYKKTYYVSDYHQMSLLRLFVLKSYGDDMMIEMSKNMNRINYYLKLYPIDLKANTFITKKSGWHYYHKIGKHFNCVGQSYNHIPGHGNLIRKDLLTMASNDYLNKFSNNKKCEAEANIFPKGYRLYIKEECQNFFDIINQTQFYKRKNTINIQFVIKIGYGVHRGDGVFIFDNEKEKEIRDQYENGLKCGEITINQIAQEYIFDPLLIDNHKFDLRIYMLIASVNPLIVLYHDGFLRVSINKYNLKSNERNIHLTNTEIFKKLIYDMRVNGSKYNGMNEEQLREFQMRNMEQLYQYLYDKKIVSSKEEAELKIKSQIKKSFLHLAKMVENNLSKSPNNFELFGVDFIIDKSLNLFVLEVNPSPMLIGTAERKTVLMKKLMTGMFDIVFKLRDIRTKRAVDFVENNYERIFTDTEISDLKEEFNTKIYTNRIDNMEGILQGNPWELCYNGIETGNKKYFNLVSDDCIAVLENN